MRVEITELHPKSIWGKEVINKVFEIKNRPTKYMDDWFFIEPIDESFENNYVLCKYIEVPEPLKPCWKCGEKAYQWRNPTFHTGLVTCHNSDCMPLHENYTVDEWQNHPRPEPSAMSDVARWIDEEKANVFIRVGNKIKQIKPIETNNPGKNWTNANEGYDIPDIFIGVPGKKLSWWQKIRGYDDLQARCNSAEGMRDHYKETLESWESIAISKARELELMTKVADNWQAKAIEANKRADDFITDVNKYLDEIEVGCEYLNELMDEEEKIIGRRLKFSVGHNHITITIGNPVTLFENFISNSGKLEWSISRCSRKDTYDWKQGAIKSLDNYCDEHNHAKKLRRDLRKALAKKYPEIFDEPNRV
jgi:hypothetical protein